MGIIIRYILRELGVTFLFGFVALTGSLLIVGLVRAAMENHLPFIDVLKLVPFVFAEMSYISLPVTLLLAVTMFFARMSGNNEVIALKALGIPPRTFLIPIFVIAFFVSIVGVRINEWAITKGRSGFNFVLYHSTENILIETLKKKHQFTPPNNQFTIFVDGVGEQKQLIKPKIILKKGGVTFEAQSAQIKIDFDEDTLMLKLDNGRMTREGIVFGDSGNRLLPIPLSEFMSSAGRSGPSSLGLNEINKESKKTVEQIEQQRRIIAAHRTFAAYMGSVDDWTTSQIKESNTEILRLQKLYRKLSVEPPRRWANGFCCFFFVWLGAPLAIWMRKSDFFASFFACFVPILLLYYPLLMFGLTQAKSGALPPMCVWTANVGIGLIGLWFLRQIHRY